jgi:hypothetical protein
MKMMIKTGLIVAATHLTGLWAVNAVFLATFKQLAATQSPWQLCLVYPLSVLGLPCGWLFGPQSDLRPFSTVLNSLIWGILAALLLYAYRRNLHQRPV